MAFSWETDQPTQPQPAQPMGGTGGGFSWERDDPYNQPEEQVSWIDAFGRGAADAASFGFGDEGAGIISGIQAAAQGGSYLDAYNQRVAEARERLRMAREQRPWATGIGAAAGAGATFLVPGVGAASSLRWAGAAGRALDAAAKGRGAGALLAQMGRGAGAGAIAGGIYGAAAGDGDLQRRATSALGGTALGAGFGALGVPVFGALQRAAEPVTRPIGRALTNWREGVVRSAMRGQTNALIGPPIGGGGGAAPPPAGPQPNVPKSAVSDIDRLLGRERIGVDEFGSRIGSALSEGEAARSEGRRTLGRVLADVGGQQFQAKTRALAQGAGQTGPGARAIALERAREMPQAITQDMRDDLGVQVSPSEALDMITTAIKNNRDGYQRFHNVRPGAGPIDNINSIMGDDPAFQRALERLAVADRRAIARARRSGTQPEPPAVISENGVLRLSPQTNGRQILRLKTAVDDELSAGKRRTDMTSYEKGEMVEDIGPLHDDFMRALDAALPGYNEVRAVRGGLFEATEALDAGRKMLNLRPEEIARRMEFNAERNRPTTRFEREHYRVAIADEVLRRVFRRAAASEGRTKNAAEALDNLEIQNVLRAAFGESPNVERFLAGINNRSEMLRRAQEWIGGSSTFANAAQAGDQVLADMFEAGLGGPTGAARTGIRRLGQIFLSGQNEQRNNALGNALLSRLDDASPDERAYIEALLRRLRERETGRLNRAEGAGVGGVEGATGGGTIYDDY